MTDYRALCARMADRLDRYQQLLTDDRTELDPLAAEARKVLDQPEPEGPTPQPVDGEVADLVTWLRLTADEQPHTSGQGCIRLTRAADLLERQHPQPVPVSERLPELEDCLDEGWAWFFSPRVGWRQVVLPVSPAYTHWLPAHALPLPQPH